MRCMDRKQGRSRLARMFAVILPVLILAALGAAPPKKRPAAPPPKPEEVVTDLAFVANLVDRKVEGVGLVVGLDNTGSDPPPSWYRTKILTEMRKARVEDAEKILASKTTSVVLVRTTVPPGVTKTDPIDVEVVLPPGSTTTSLSGGRLMACGLTQVLVAGDRGFEGRVLASAVGPVMTGTTAKPDDLKCGRVLGGARSKEDIPFSIIIRERRRSVTTAAMLQNAINRRFSEHDGIDRKGLASAKTDTYVELKVPKLYHNNQDRYFRVVKLLPILDNEELREQRLSLWSRELLDSATAGVAAMRLEGFGPNAVDVLKKGLQSTDASVRFFSAETLAYLGDASGVEVLADSAEKQPEFRKYALLALGAMDQAAGLIRLRQLMTSADPNVRYGAFGALRDADPHDASLGQIRVLDDPEGEVDQSEEAAVSQVMAITTRSKRKPARRNDPFALYAVDCEGPPMVHVARTGRSEIVLFGARQDLLTPVVINGQGSLLVNAADGDSSAQISRITPSALDTPDRKVTTSLDVVALIRSMAELGATYPEILSVLEAASRQGNLAGTLLVDAVPVASPVYTQKLLYGSAEPSKKDNSVQTASDESKKATKRGILQRWRDRFRRPTPSQSASPSQSPPIEAKASQGQSKAP